MSFENDSGFEKDRLTMLATSQNLLILASQARWQELAVLQMQWNQLLSAMIEKHGAKLEPIRKILDADSQQLQKIVKASQATLAADFSKMNAQNKSIRKYLK